MPKIKKGRKRKLCLCLSFSAGVGRRYCATLLWVENEKSRKNTPVLNVITGFFLLIYIWHFFLIFGRCLFFCGDIFGFSLIFGGKCRRVEYAPARCAENKF